MANNSKDEKEALKRIRKCKKTQSTELDLFGLKVTAFPSDVFELPWLENANFVNMALPSFPNLFHRLPNLRRLCLGDNHLKECPSSLASLKELKVLRLFISDSISPPESLGELTQCEELFIEGGCGDLPGFLGQMSALRTVYLQRNFFTSLPESIGNLQNLERLEIEFSYIERLPEGMKNCLALRSLTVQAPFMRVIPDWLGEMPNLRFVSFAGCNLRDVPENLGTHPLIREIWLSLNPLSDEFWNLKRQEDDIWVRWHGKLCRIGIRREPVVVPTAAPDDGSLYSGPSQSIQVEHGLLVVQATNTQLLIVELSNDSEAERVLLDLSAIARIDPRFVMGISWKIIDHSRLFLDVYVKMAPDGIKRYLYMVDWRSMTLLSSGSVRKPGRDGTLPVLLPGNRIAIDNEYDAIVVDLSNSTEQGMLFETASRNSEIDHEELQVLGAAQLDDQRLIFHWGQVGESSFETYCFGGESQWQLESRIQVSADEIESFIRLGDHFVYLEVWVAAKNIEETQDAGIYEIGTIRALNRDVPLPPVLCASVEGLQEVSTSGRRKRLVVVGYDPMLCCIDDGKLAYLDPSGNIIVTTLSGDYRVLKPREGNRFQQLCSWNGRLFARAEHTITEVDIDSASTSNF